MSPNPHALIHSIVLPLAACALLAPHRGAASNTDNGHCHLARWVPPGAIEGAHFGRSVDLHETTAVVGGEMESAQVYERTGGTWQPGQTLVSPTHADAYFGYCVGVYGDHIVVTAPQESTNGTYAGALYLYGRDAGGDWVLEETFYGSDSDNLGWGVAIDGGGSNGALRIATFDLDGDVYLYESTPGGWHLRTIAASWNPSLSADSIDLSGDTLVVGVDNDNSFGLDSGAVYHHFVPPAPSPLDFVQALVPGDGTENQGYGASVAVDGQNRLVVGARFDDEAGSVAGAAYVYDAQPSVAFPFYLFEAEHKIVPEDGDDTAQFGNAVAIDGDRVAIGALTQVLGVAGGAVHVYQRSTFPTVNWSRNDRLSPDDSLPSDFFGYAVDLQGDHVLVGAYGVDEGLLSTGATYLVSLTRKGLGGGACPCDTLAFATSYGSGKAGSLGVPLLTVNQAPVPGESTLFTLDGVPQGLQPVIFWGNVPAAIPFDGGTFLMADPNGEWLPVAGVLNRVGIQWQVPADLALCGSEVVFQALFLDPAGSGPLKTAQSNGLHTIVGF